MPDTLNAAIEHYRDNSTIIEIKIHQTKYKKASILDFKKFLQDPTKKIQKIFIHYHYSPTSARSLKKFFKYLSPILNAYNIQYSFIVHTIEAKFREQKDRDLQNEVFIEELFTRQLIWLDLRGNTLNTLSDYSFDWLIQSINSATRLLGVELSDCQVELLSEGERLQKLKMCIAKHPAIRSIFKRTILADKSLNEIEEQLLATAADKMTKSFDLLREPRSMDADKDQLQIPITKYKNTLQTRKPDPTLHQFSPSAPFNIIANHHRFQTLLSINLHESDARNELLNLKNSRSSLINHPNEFTQSCQDDSISHQDTQCPFMSVYARENDDRKAYESLFSFCDR